MSEVKKVTRSKTVKGLGLHQLINKKYKYLEPLPEELTRSFGKLTENILMIIYGASGNGKSRMLMQLLKVIMKFGNVDYLALEEGHRSSMQRNASENLTLDEHSGKIRFYDHTMDFPTLVSHLKKKKSAKFIVIDSLQYWRITYKQYQALKEMFPGKGFIFISHAKGKGPSGKLAVDIEYDVDYKVRVEGFVAFVKSREGGCKPYVIWEEGAKKYWKRKYKKVIE